MTSSDSSEEPGTTDGTADGTGPAVGTDGTGAAGEADPDGTGSTDGAGATAGAEGGPGPGPAGATAGPAGAVDGAVPRRHPRAVLTTTTARPEGGGRAAPGDAPAPARQWPLLTVLGMTFLGLLVVGTDLFAQAFRVGTILVGAALLTGAVLRRMLPSVGMLAVRSRFTDMVTYGVMGGLIVLLALMVQPEPWLRIPFLEDVLHLTVTT
ncbi:DUF3017 domain-containing protein [Streptomyces sp. NPDC053493]|uniref:DUF3017 domain-containing protein n=1 Tax=Streptomyces sp. NPDC053493 TaxID=3365705 RepID=UPI0037D79A4E